jgi:hypothetical protein
MANKLNFIKAVIEDWRAGGLSDVDALWVISTI